MRPKSFNWLLIQLILGLLIPTLLFVGVLLWQFSGSERSRVEAETRGVSRDFAVALDREVNGVLTTLQALATSPSLQSRDYEAFYKQVTEVSRLQGINISLRDLAGHAILTTRAPLGDDVGVPPILAQADQQVLRSGAPLVSNIFTSTVAARPVFQIMAAPVLVGQAPTYILGASIDVGYLAEAIRREHLPPGWIGAIVDRNGVFVARTEHHDELAGKQASAGYRERAVGEAGSYYGNNSDGQKVLVGYAKSDLTGWTTAASVSVEAVDAPLRRSLWALIALGAGLSLIGGAIALFVGRRLSYAFNCLGKAVGAIASENPVEVVSTPVLEINQVAAALRIASEQLQDRAQERDAAEMALRDINETLEHQVAERTRERNRLWESTHDLVAVGGLDGHLQTVNPAWCRLLGWTDDELISRPLLHIVDPADRNALNALMETLRESGKAENFVVRLISKSGKIQTITWSVVSDPDVGLFYIVGRDLTAQRQAEEALRQSQKMEALGQLTGGVAHDFNNMLAVITGGLDLLQRRLARGETDVSRYVEGALDGAKRAASLTQRLLAFSRQQALSPEPIDANRMIAGMTELLTRTLGEQNRIETVLSAGLWRAMADPSQLENVILNLAVNARDAMPDGGRLTIETANSHIDEEYARSNEIETGQYVLIAVTDTGTGMGPDAMPDGGRLTIETANSHIDEEYARSNEIETGQYVLIAVTDTGTGMGPDIMAKAFDPFFTTKAVGQGTGLGLSQVFGVARQSGGHVKIYSEVGHGTTIKLYLPRAYGPASPPAVKQIATPVQGVHRDEIIMVVEDDDRVRNLAVEALRELGYTVVYASSGKEALKLIETGQEMSLLLTDIVMPEMTGRQLVDAVAPSRPNLKVLYMTGYSRNAIVHNGVLDPGTNLLAKPFGLDQLAISVRRALDS